MELWNYLKWFLWKKYYQNDDLFNPASGTAWTQNNLCPEQVNKHIRETGNWPDMAIIQIV